jgi:hypothetical protein
MVAVRVDLVPLFDALTASDERGVIAEISQILGDEVAGGVLAGRLSIPAALGDRVGAAVPALVAAGRLSDWMRVIPPGPEPEALRRRALMPTIALANAALFAAKDIATGLANPNPPLPEPLFPKDITHHAGPWGALRDAVRAGDSALAGRILMGFYGSGTDYREMEGALYAALNGTFAGDGFPLLMTLAATQALDFVDWGDRVPAFFYWLLPLLMKGSAELDSAKALRDFLAQPAHDLDFVRTRLTMSDPTAAGPVLRQAVASGTTAQVFDETFAALKRGANGTMVGAQIAVAAAEHLAGVPLNNAEAVNRAQVALRVANTARTATRQVQDLRVLPIIFHAGNLVNQTIRANGAQRAEPAPGAPGGALPGGLIESSVLRNLERQIAGRDEVGTRATVRRYTQMGFPGRSLLGTFGQVAARASVAADANGRGMLVTQAAGETFLALTPAQQAAEGVALLDAIAHIIVAQPADQSLAQRVEQTLGIAAGA